MPCLSMIFSENRYPPPDQVRGQAFSGSCSVPDILQEPFGRDFPAEALAAGKLVDLAGDGEELHALQIAALRIGDLIAGGAALDLAGGEVRQRDPLVQQRIAVPAVADLATGK